MARTGNLGGTPTCEDELLPAVSIVATDADGLEHKETGRDEN